MQPVRALVLTLEILQNDETFMLYKIDSSTDII